MAEEDDIERHACADATSHSCHRSERYSQKRVAQGTNGWVPSPGLGVILAHGWAGGSLCAMERWANQRIGSLDIGQFRGRGNSKLLQPTRDWTNLWQSGRSSQEFAHRRPWRR